MQIDRRQFVRGTVLTGATLGFVGFASADGRTRYLLTADGSGVRDRIEGRGFDVENELAGGGVLVAVGPSEAVEDLQGIPGVAAAARDFAMALERPAAGEQVAEEPAFWDLQWDKSRTEVETAHETATGDGSTIAVVDTGIDPTHPDLGNLNVEESAAIIDGEVTVGDDEWVHYHGTHVAGIAAAQGAGVLGTAPDAELLNLRVFSDEGDLVAFASDVMLALEYAADHGADVANLSLGSGPLPPEANAGGLRAARQRVVQDVVRRGTLVVASAGNDEANLQQGGYFHLTSSVAGAVSVSATAPNDARSFYSNYGTSDVDVGAPGGGYEGLIETYCGYAEWVRAGMPLPEDDPREPGTETQVCFDEDGSPVVDEDDAAVCYPCTIREWPYPFNLVYSTYPGGSYAWAAGTSMAAPQVAGTIALVREVAPDANANQVQRAIERSADLVDGDGDADLGAGRLNAADAVDLA